jgi:hypothetical protein
VGFIVDILTGLRSSPPSPIVLPMQWQVAIPAS